jgi:hypothetical protein
MPITPRWTLLVAFAFAFSLIVGCEVLPPDPQVEQWGDQSTIGSGGSGGSGSGGSGGSGGSYEYDFSCPSGGGGSVPIPSGSAACESALEFYSRTYGCNLVEDFTEANCRVCDECGNFNGACTVCGG